jgi:hypothetical protein
MILRRRDCRIEIVTRYLAPVAKTSRDALGEEGMRPGHYSFSLLSGNSFTERELFLISFPLHLQVLGHLLPIAC